MNISKENRFFYKAIQLIAIAFLTKGLGFVREMILANYYGTSYVSDVFVAVQNIPSVIFTVFGTAVTTGFIPLYTEMSVRKGKKNADIFANNIFNIFLLFSIVMCIVGILFSKQLVLIFAGGFTGKTFELCNYFAKLIMPTSVAIVLGYVYNAYLQISGMFNQNSLMNVPYNIVQMIFIVLGFHLDNDYVLAIGLLLASYSQLIYLRILMKKNTEFIHSWYFDFRQPQIKQMLILVGPVFISTGVNQLNSIVDKAMASRLVEGSISALNYSNEVANIVVQVIILSMTTILYPKMTELFARNNESERNSFVQNYIGVVALVVLPLSVLIFFFSEEIIQILFGRGAFQKETVLFVSKALKVYAIGIVGASFRDVFNKIFYSMQNTVIPMWNGVICVVINIGMNFFLIAKWGYLGLAFATTFSTIICTSIMFIQLLTKTNGINVKGILIEVLKIAVATIGLYVALHVFTEMLPIESSILRCVIHGCGGGIVYFIVLGVVKEERVKKVVDFGLEGWRNIKSGTKLK